MIAGHPLVHVAVVDAQERPGEEDVVAAGQVLVEAGAEGEQARHRPRTSIAPSDGLDDPGEHLEERALAGAVRADDGQRLAVDEPERDVAQGPEVGSVRSRRR